MTPSDFRHARCLMFMHVDTQEQYANMQLIFCWHARKLYQHAILTTYVYVCLYKLLSFYAFLCLFYFKSIGFLIDWYFELLIVFVMLIINIFKNLAYILCGKRHKGIHFQTREFPFQNASFSYFRLSWRFCGGVCGGRGVLR